MDNVKQIKMINSRLVLRVHLIWIRRTHLYVFTRSPAFPFCHASPPSCCRHGCTWSCIAGQTHYPCRRRADLGCPRVWWSAASAGPPGDTLWGRPALTWCQDTKPRHRLRCQSQVWWKSRYRKPRSQSSGTQTQGKRHKARKNVTRYEQRKKQWGIMKLNPMYLIFPVWKKSCLHTSCYSMLPLNTLLKGSN